MRRSALVILVVLFVAAGAVALQGDGDGGGRRPARVVLAAGLREFDSCPALLDYMRDATVTAQDVGWAMAPGAAEGRRVAAAGDAAESAAAPLGVDDFSATNVQEAGVDEADVVKTDGRVIVAVARNRLHVVDPTGGRPRLAATLGLQEAGDHELLLAGDRVLVVSRAWPQPRRLPGPASAGDAPEVMVAPEQTVLTAVDVSDMERPRVLGTVELDGSYVTARATGTSARIVLRSSPTLAIPGGPAASESDWRSHVATSTWLPTGGRGTTTIHAFDTGDRRATRYVGSGTVDGHLLNQWSLSEHEGFLRVATTDADQAESRLSVLAERDGGLVAVGGVGGLGRGERIYAVRYLGDIGFVVTFRQTDPLYTLDLSDPTTPRVVGELEISGYSAYLHPVGEGLLLGVGQDATAEGRVQGTQLSLFDVSDLARPALVARASLGAGQSAVEFDHRAFLWWAPSGLAMVPVTTWDERGGSSFTGAVGYRVGRDAIAEAGRVAHAGRSGLSSGAMVTRSLVVGEAVYTLSDGGLLASDLGTLSDRAWAPFPR